MRVAYSIPSHREYYRSGVPSEPILAEAAVQEMAELSNVPQAVAQLVAEELVEKREGGDLFGYPVPPFDFRQVLLGDNFDDIILPGHAVNDSFEDAFKNAYVRFTHFGRFGNDNPITAYTTSAAFARGMAIQRHKYQPYLHLVVPIVFAEDNDDELSTKLDLCSVSAIFVRTKHSDQLALAIDEKDLEKGGFFEHMDGSTTAKPYISLSMHLGAQDRTEVKVIQIRSNEQQESKRPRFEVEVAGFDESLYPAAWDDIDSYRALLSEGDFLLETLVWSAMTGFNAQHEKE